MSEVPLERHGHGREEAHGEQLLALLEVRRSVESLAGRRAPVVAALGSFAQDARPTREPLADARQARTASSAMMITA